jgi:hypothetical protein
MLCDTPDPQVEWRHALDAGHVLILGDMHGTEQIPEFAALAVCSALRQGRSVGLFVEWPSSLQARLADTTALLSDPFFAGTYQDGRRSGAMLQLVALAESWTRNGAQLAVIAMDPVDGDRNVGMAAAVRAWTTEHPQSVAIVLVGNVHSRLTQGWRQNAAYRPMGLQLIDLGDKLRSLDVRYANGVGWNCQPDCGVHLLYGEAHGDRWTIDWAAARGAYDGTYYVGVPTASRPAVEKP